MIIGAYSCNEEPVEFENSPPYSELGFHWPCGEGPVPLLNTFKLLRKPRKRSESDSAHRSRTVQVRGTDGIFGTHKSAADPD